MDIGITAIGTAVPPYKRNQLDAAQLIGEGLNLRPAERRLIRTIYKATGIETRYSVLSDYSKDKGEFDFFPNDPTLPFPTTKQRMQVYKENALPLALAAIENCFKNSNLNVEDITHVITVSCTGMYAPGLDIEIVQHLKMQSHTKRTAINFMGCYGAFNAIKVAHDICKAEPNAKVLIVSVELCTLHFQPEMKTDNIISNAIFADGAAAAIIQNQPQSVSLNVSQFYCDLLPQSSDAMAWHIADNGFDIVLSTYVPEVIESGIEKFVTKLLAHQELSLENIDIYAIHPGGLKILEACEKSLGISKEDNKYAYQVLKNYGNMSSATILFVLKEVFENLTPADHQKTLFSCAFGPGLTLESMLININA